MKIDNKTPREWAESGYRLVLDSGSCFADHYELDDDSGDLVPEWPPDVTKENSKLFAPYEVTVQTDTEIVANGEDTATVEVKTTASETREVTVLVDGIEVGRHQIAPGEIISENITTTTTQETIEVVASGEGKFGDSATIDVIQP